MCLGQVARGTTLTSTYAWGTSTRLIRWAQVPHQSSVVRVRRIALGAAPNGVGWLLDNGERCGGSLLLLAAAPVVPLTEVLPSSPNNLTVSRREIRRGPSLIFGYARKVG